MPATKELEKKTIIVPPFTIEADHPRNSDLLLQSIPNCRLRSVIKASRTTLVNKQSDTNEGVIPKDQAQHLGMLPTIPGMRLAVDPEKLRYEVTDPLHENKDVCKNISSALRADGRPYLNEGLRGVPPQAGALDVHRMKTLCREVIYLLDAKEARIRKGLAPDLEDASELPGNFLLNPGSRVPNNQPEY